jgi:hypothetical protein
LNSTTCATEDSSDGSSSLLHSENKILRFAESKLKRKRLKERPKYKTTKKFQAKKKPDLRPEKLNLLKKKLLHLAKKNGRNNTIKLTLFMISVRKFKMTKIWTVNLTD